MFDLISCLGQTTHIDVALDDDFESEELADGTHMLRADIELIGDEGQMLGGVVTEYRGIQLSPITPTVTQVWLNQGPEERRYLGTTVEDGDLWRDDDYGDDPLARQVGLMILASEVHVSPFRDSRLDLDFIASCARSCTRTRTADIYRGALPLRAAESLLWDPALAKVMEPGELEESYGDFLSLVSDLFAGSELIFREQQRSFDVHDPQAGLYRFEHVSTLAQLNGWPGLLPENARIVDCSGHLYVSGDDGRTVEARVLPEGSRRCAGQDLSALWESASLPHLADLLGVSIEARRGLDSGVAERLADWGSRGNPPLSACRGSLTAQAEREPMKDRASEGHMDRDDGR